jgi:hypothetical protein
MDGREGRGGEEAISVGPICQCVWMCGLNKDS